MKHLFAGSLVLLLSLPVAATGTSAQDARQSIDALFERGNLDAGPNWRGLGKNYAAAVFVHRDLRKSDGGRLAVWTDHELPAPQYFEKEKAYFSTRERVVIDCKTLRIGITNTVYYAGHFGKGEIVAASRTDNPEMMDVVPDSLEDRLVRTACAPKPRPARVRKTKPAKAEKGGKQERPEKQEKPATPVTLDKAAKPAPSSAAKPVEH